MYTFTAPAEIWSIAFSSDGRTLAAGTAGADGQVQLWDYFRKKELTTLTAPGAPAYVDGISFSHDGREVACTYRFTKRIGVWDLATLRVRLELTNFVQLVNSVAFSPDDSLLLAVTGPSYTSKLPGEA